MTELSWIDPPLVVKWQRVVPVKITSCNYASKSNASKFYCFLFPSLVSSHSLLFPFTLASKCLSFFADVSSSPFLCLFIRLGLLISLTLSDSVFMYKRPFYLYSELRTYLHSSTNTPHNIVYVDIHPEPGGLKW